MSTNPMPANTARTHMAKDPRARRLVTHGEAVKTTHQHKKPCADCPWSRKSLSGWLGGMTAEQWLQCAHGEGLIECHTATVQCAGAAIFRSNVCKSMRDPSLLRLPADRKAVFSWNDEFIKHHKKPFTESALSAARGDATEGGAT